jgi:hypothetical protein
MKQTAVEWLEDCLTEQYPNGKFVWNTRADIEALFKRAKEMEKQQIMVARVNAPLLNTESKYDYVIEAEQYYNETFNK